MVRAIALSACLAIWLPTLPCRADDVVTFRGTVRSVLTQTCLTCHNPDKKKGGLDLSRRATALAGGNQGAVVVSGKPMASVLYRKLTTGKMPPQQPLMPAQVAAFKRWIEAGVPYEGEPLAADWWAFRPLHVPAIPHSPYDALARNSIDRFVFAKLAEKGLRPSPPVSRRALLRRVTLDLTGLPPTPAEMDAFLADHSPQAYEHVVDRLLASPAYGERWSRHWLDVVRFGESNGYEQNHLRPDAWPYRDYVIRALNKDIPYPQFVAEQLAGDVLAQGDPNVEAATGFLVAGVHDTVGIQTVEGTLQQRANDLDDIVSTIGATFLGLTVGCAKCHDHRFDPIPQRDYYRLVAVVAGVRHGERALMPLAARKHEKQLVELDRQRHELEGQIADLDAAARHAVLASQGVHPVPRPAVSVRRNVEDFAPVAARFIRLTILATRDGSEPCVDELQIYGPEHRTNLALASRGARASASSLLPGYAIHRVSHLNDGRFGNDWSWISKQPGGGWAQIELPRTEAVSRVVWGRDAGGTQPRFQDRLASRYRVETSIDGRHWQTVTTSADRAAAPEAIPEAILRHALTNEQRQARARLTVELAHVDAAMRTLSGAALGGLRSAYIGQFTTPDAIAILKRGDVMHRGRPVKPGALSELPGLSGELKSNPKLGEPGRRLALAYWLNDARNPLPTRVIVNRIWQYHFGRGIVGTPSDFGANGERPTHPVLLDWLAFTFRAHGSRLKYLHRLIVTSYTYRQASAIRSVEQAADAGNRLLWRMPLQRLEAEAVRDAILQASGKLDRRMGGPGYRLFRYRVVNVAIYEPLDRYGPDTWRRGIYRQAARAIREDLMANFDCPECAQRTPRRDVTTTPLQALSLLNGPFVNEQAEFLAQRVQREAGNDPSAQVKQAFRLAFGRPCSAAEQQAGLALVHEDGLTTLCRALFNANEFLYY